MFLRFTYQMPMDLKKTVPRLMLHFLSHMHQHFLRKPAIQLLWEHQRHWLL